MHAATVIQKSQRAASKKALTTELKGQLYKRSNMTPRFQRRWFYVVGDAAGCAAAQFCAILRKYSDATPSSSGTTRCATASATSTARAAARRSESPSPRSPRSRSTTRCGTPRAIRAQFGRNSGAILAQFSDPPSTHYSYEWSVDATVRDAKYAFRCDTHDEMTRWVDGLRMLMM